MSVLIAVPVFRIGCKVGIDRGRAWSVIDEVVLWAATRRPRTIEALAAVAHRHLHNSAGRHQNNAVTCVDNGLEWA